MTDGSVEQHYRTYRYERGEKARETLAKTSPQHRLIEPEEVASIAVFLAQESSKGITGQGHQYRWWCDYVMNRSQILLKDAKI